MAVFVQNYLPSIQPGEGEIVSLARLFKTKTFPRKTVLLRAGWKWEEVFFIQKGLIRMYYTDAEGREFNKAFYGEQDCIWPVAPRDRHEPSLFSIDAVEAVEALVCPFAALYDWMMTHGYWETFALPIAETLLEQKFVKEHDLLTLSATQRFQKFRRQHPQIVARLPDYHLASYLGVTHVSLSRIKKVLNFNK